MIGHKKKHGRIKAGLATVMAMTTLLTSCSPNQTEKDSASCDIRTIELRLEGIDRLRYKNLCMTSLGYDQDTQSQQCKSAVIHEATASICYSSSWAAWIRGKIPFK